MAFCETCKTDVQVGMKFCPGCGAAMTAGPSSGESAGVQGQAAQSGTKDAEENKTMSIMAYILFFVPLLTGAHKTSAFVKYHTNQGTVLFLAAALWSVAYSILSAILVFIPYVGWILMVLLGLTGFLFLGLCIMGIVNAANGRIKPLPLIGKFTIIK